MNFQRVEYKLINNDTKKSIDLEHDPKEWDNSNRTLKREKTHGVVTELSKNLVFVKDGRDFLKLAYDFKGGEADVTLEEYRFHPKTSHPYLHSTGTFDFSDYSCNKLEVKVPFKTGGLNALIKSQEKEKFEIERLESINGNVIDAIDKQLVALTSRNIFLISQYEIKENNNIAALAVESNAGNTRAQSTGIPLSLFSKSQEQAESIISGSYGNEINGTTGMMFFLDADRERTLNLTFNFDFDVFFQQYENVQWCRYKISLTTYENGNIYDVKNRDVLYELASESPSDFPIVLPSDKDFAIPSFTLPISVPQTKKTVTLQAGESLAIELLLQSDMFVDNQAGVRANAQNITGSLTIEEDSFFEDSQTEAVFLKDIGEKLMQIITGEKGRFYSYYLNNGTFSKLALTLGLWIRQFYYTVEVIDGKELPKYAMQISIDEFLETLNVVCNTGHHIETINGYETLVVEDLKYYFQPSIAIFLNDEVSDYEEENATEFCHSSLEFGYKETGEYEEAMALDEYNIKTGFTTPLKRVETKYSKVSPSRADTYGKEFARRKLKRDYPTTDTSYDKDKFLLDLKEGFGLALEERNYLDDFELLPTGIFSPETATNLRITPSQIERRHQWFYGSGVIKHQEDKIRYSNTEGNNSLTTKEAGKTARSERDDLEIKNLEKALFEPKFVTFKHPLTYDIVQQLNGKTNVNGRDIPNFYFKVQYVYQGKKETGYLYQQTQKQNNLGEFKILKAI